MKVRFSLMFDGFSCKFADLETEMAFAPTKGTSITFPTVHNGEHYHNKFELLVDSVNWTFGSDTVKVSLAQYYGGGMGDINRKEWSLELIEAMTKSEQTWKIE